MLASRLPKRGSWGVSSGLGRFFWLLVTPSALAFHVKPALSNWRFFEGTNCATVKYVHIPIRNCFNYGPVGIWKTCPLIVRPLSGTNDLENNSGAFTVSGRRVCSPFPMAMCTFDGETLQRMSRKDLQSVAKQAGVRANMKSSAIISELVSQTKEIPPPFDNSGKPLQRPVGEVDAPLAAEVLRETLNSTSTDGVLSLLERLRSSADFPQSASVWHELITAASEGSSGKMASLYNCVFSVLGSTDAKLCLQLFREMRCTPDTVSASLVAGACFRAGDDGLADDILREQLARAASMRRAEGIERQLKKRQRIVQQSSKTRARSMPGAHPLEVAVGGEGGPLKVLYEDAGLVAVSKPAAMLVHPTASTPLKGPGSMTLCDGLLCAYGTEGVSWLGEYAGVVHRLDRGTSGVMVMAKTARAHALLVSAFFGRKVKKEYQALVAGKPSWGPEGHEVEAEVDGLWARSSCRSIEHFQAQQQGEGVACLVEVRPEQGRKHQVRVHLAGLGHPLFLDPLYGDSRVTGHSSRRKTKQNPKHAKQSSSPSLSLQVPGAVRSAAEEWKDGRFFLHSAKLALPSSLLDDGSSLRRSSAHSSTAKDGEDAVTEWAAQRPEWFERVLDALRAERSAA